MSKFSVKKQLEARVRAKQTALKRWSPKKKGLQFKNGQFVELNGLLRVFRSFQKAPRA